MQTRIDEVSRRILAKIVPTASEREKILSLAEHVKDNVLLEADKAASPVDVRIGGSVAKDTWLSREADVDVFILFPTTFSKQKLGEVGLGIARKALKNYHCRERYAEHPYLEAFIDGTRVNVVPCYNVEKGKWLSAADRTPFHTTFVNEKLQQHDVKNDIRLFKAFMKGIGIYGAEIKIGGFSGYLCELIVLNYQSFIKSLRVASEWQLREVIDIENLYAGRFDEARRFFDAPLIVVDPVDANRNVAAAVSESRLGEFIMASRCFLDDPRQAFFQREEKALSIPEFKEAVAQLDFDLLFVVFKSEELIPDIRWGQLYKSLRAVRKLLVQQDFNVLKTSAWSDEREKNILVFALESKTLPPSKLRVGPAIYSKEATSFLAKHLNAESTSIGPWAEDRRWMISVKRRYTDAGSLIEDKLKDGGQGIGVARRFTEEIRGSFKVLFNEEIISIYSADPGFVVFLTGFLQKKLQWLR